jgi:hypothetical protein
VTFLEGGAEIDLVRSGLEDVMWSTWARIADIIEEETEYEAGMWGFAFCHACQSNVFWRI